MSYDEFEDLCGEALKVEFYISFQTERRKRKRAGTFCICDQSKKVSNESWPKTKRIKFVNLVIFS